MVAEELGQPDLEPRSSGDARPGHDPTLLDADGERSGLVMGHPGGPLVVPVLPRPDLGEASVMLLRKLSQSWSSNSSSGMARVRREPHVRSASSGETRSPYTSRLAVADNQRRAGVQARAATAAAAIEMSSNRRLLSSAPARRRQRRRSR